jgi:hypothetical protein
MTEALALAAGLYTMVYVLIRPRPRRVTVLCPLRSLPPPADVADRLIEFPSPAPPFSGDVTLGYVDPGALKAFLERPVFAAGRRTTKRAIEARTWTPSLLTGLALEVLHRDSPRSLVVDFRPPPAEDWRVSTGEKDVDLAMYGYEILCRARRDSRYGTAGLRLVLCAPEATRTFGFPGDRP